jgi:hypothetical protein
MAKGKAETVSFKRRDLLDDSRKRYKDLLEISPFQVVIEISYTTYLKRDKPLEKAGEAVLDEAEKGLNKQVADLANQIVDLQEDEKKGDDKAAAKANTALKQVNEAIKDLLGELNTDVREAVEAAIKKETGESEKLSAIGRNTCKGIKLKKGVFTGAANLEAIEDFGDAADKLLEYGESLLKKSTAEGNQRDAAVKALLACLDAIKAAPKNMDFKQIVKDNDKLFRKAESAVRDYNERLEECHELAGKAAGAVDSLSKLLRSEKELSDQKKAAGDYEKTVESLAKQLSELDDLTTKAARAIDGDTSDKDGRKAVETLGKEDAYDKKAKAVRDAGKKLVAEKKKL